MEPLLILIIGLIIILILFNWFLYSKNRKNKVYCTECRHYANGECWHPNNYKGDYELRKKETLESPKILNAKNNCHNFNGFSNYYGDI